MAYYRLDKNKRMLVVANFGKKEAEIKLEYPVNRIVLSNKNRILPEKNKKQILTLDSCEVIVLDCGCEKEI